MNGSLVNGKQHVNSIGKLSRAHFLRLLSGIAIVAGDRKSAHQAIRRTLTIGGRTYNVTRNPVLWKLQLNKF